MNAPGRDPERTTSLRDTYRRQLIDNIGGWSGALIAAIPTAVFVIVNVTTNLRAGIVAAVATALVLAAYRFLRGQPIQQALSALLGVAVAALIAARTGQARGYFLLGIVTSFVYAVPLAVSLIVRRPLIGVLWEFLDPTPDPRAARVDADQSLEQSDPPRHVDSTPAPTEDAEPPPPWHRRRPLLVAYSWATLAATLVFLARGAVQLVLYGANRTGWLAFARIAMGYPLFVAAAGLSFVVISRARRRLVAAGDGAGALRRR